MRIKNFLAAIGALAVALVLQGCGGGAKTSNDVGRVRLLNATAKQTLDLRVDASNIIAGVTPGATGGYVEHATGSVTFQIGATGSATTLLSLAGAVDKGVDYSVVAYTSGGSLHAAYLVDAETAPSSGAAKFRAFNLSSEAGTLDVYVTAVGDDSDLSTQTPINAGVSASSTGTYNEVGAGAYRIRATAADDPTDVRLDIAALTLSDQEITTLVLTSTGGGVLVNGIVLDQGGGSAAYDNATMRLRLVADATAGSKVTLAQGSTGLVAQNSPSVGNYITVPSDLSTLTLKVNGAALAMPTGDAGAGTDVTLMVYGAAASPTAVLIRDDNHLPTASTKTKVRLVHGVNGLTDPISLDIDYTTVASDVGFASASTPGSVTATGAAMRFEVMASGTAVYPADTDITIAAQSVYTLFVLGDSTTPVHLLRKDR